MAAVRKLIVEVVDARNLAPKDGHGTSSPYVVLDFYGQRRKTRVVARDLNPVWNEVLEFNVGKPSDVFGDMLEVDVNHDRNLARRPGIIFWVGSGWIQDSLLRKVKRL
ncbi:putative protein kinase C [Helianthus annuus]|nr:putative protein kinase C [Helianthus annuus]